MPAFYSDWFVNCVRAGYVRWVNPFSKRVHEVSLLPEDVIAYVFWSKNYLPLLPHLDELDARGCHAIFHFTITGLPPAFEPHVPPAKDMIACAKTLSDRYGPDAVLWRYDPIVVSSITDRDYHLRRFAELSAALEGTVRRCYISFMCQYRKVQRNTAALNRETGIVYHDLPSADRIVLANDLADIAESYGIDMLSCCSDYLVGGKIKKAHCADAELFYRLYPDKMRSLPEVPTREGCGCCECTDIGAYDTCPHGCVYCYANSRVRAAINNHRHHDPTADVLGSGGAQAEREGGLTLL